MDGECICVLNPLKSRKETICKFHSFELTYLLFLMQTSFIITRLKIAYILTNTSQMEIGINFILLKNK
jgi:hypothetical protein